YGGKLREFRKETTGAFDARRSIKQNLRNIPMPRLATIGISRRIFSCVMRAGVCLSRGAQ
ncbi:MAG: hypothetical protein ABI876_03625, partial [Bacteroidota bacterium]